MASYLLELLSSMFLQNKQRHPDFPRLLKSTPVDANVKPLRAYREFIDGLTDFRDCSALLSAAEGNRSAVNVHIKDWFYTAQHYQSAFMEKCLVEKLIELEGIEQGKPLQIPLRP